MNSVRVQLAHSTQEMQADAIATKNAAFWNTQVNRLYAVFAAAFQQRPGRIVNGCTEHLGTALDVLT